MPRKNGKKKYVVSDNLDPQEGKNARNGDIKPISDEVYQAFLTILNWIQNDDNTFKLGKDWDDEGINQNGALRYAHYLGYQLDRDLVTSFLEVNIRYYEKHKTP